MGKRTDKVLDEFGEEVRLAAMRNLGTRRIGKNNSYGATKNRTLAKSLTFKRDGGELSFGSPLPYAKFIHYGVNGAEKNRNSPFSFKNKQPPISAILKWMKVKPVRLRDADGKFVEQTESRLKSTAFLIARSIRKRGIAGIAYFSEAFETMYPRYASKIADAIALDGLDDLFDQLDSDNLKL